jgi:hypothetical protein
MLTERYPLETLQKILLPRDAWRPFPAAGERDPWASLPAPVRRSHIARGEQALSFTWPPLPATLFLEFARVGNRSRYEGQRNARRSALCDLVIAECMEGEGRFLDQIANGVWITCEETYWGVPAHIHMQKAGSGLPDDAEPTVDLFAAETSALLAWACYLLGPQLDAVSPLLRPRLHREIDRRILTPNLKRDDFWWMGFGSRHVNNWNPWINSNWLTSLLLMEQDSDRRLTAAAKALRSLDRFIDPYPRDGGCDEGPGYWGRAGASLFDCLELLHSATNGAIDVYDEPLIQEIGRFIYRVHIHDRYFINFADAPALVSPPASLLFRYGRRIRDDRMAALGASAAAQQDLLNRGVTDSIGRQLAGLFTLSDLLSVKPAQPLPRDTYLPEIQVMAARSGEGSEKGLYVAAKGGHNAESHNHNDIGNFIVYADGKPLLIDAGVETYSAKTFGPNRYDIWTMQSAYHNLPTVNGLLQQPGRQFAARDVAYQSDDASAQFTLDIAGAYPPEARLNAWVRAVALRRGKDVQVTDTYHLSQPVRDLTLSLLTPCEVVLQSAGQIALKAVPLADGRTSGSGQLFYDAKKLTAVTETIPVEDARLRSIWGERLTRILLRAENPPLRDTWTLRVIQ